MRGTMQRVELHLDANGAIRDGLPEINEVQEGDVVQFDLHGESQWQFKGWMSGSASAIDNVEISPDGQAMSLTIGEGEEGDEVDITIIYQRDIRNVVAADGAPIGGAVIRSDERMVRFR